jgi:hypothetical protein
VKNPNLVKLIAPVEYLCSGLAWAGFLLAQTKILLRLSPERDSAAYFSVYATLCGLSGAVFTFLGGQVVQVLVGYGEFRMFWLLSTVVRVFALLLCPTETIALMETNEEPSETWSYSLAPVILPPDSQSERRLEK